MAPARRGPRRIVVIAMVLFTLPVAAVAAEGEGETTSTTTIPPSTTTTIVEETTTTTEPDLSTTTTITPSDSTTTTIPSDSTTTTVEETTTTTTTSSPEDEDVDGGDPFEEGVAASEDQLIPPPRIVFPVFGPSSYRDSFGEPRDGGARLHMGTDIIAPAGTPIVAVASGVVERMGFKPKAGLFVVVRHSDGWRSAYAHLTNDSPGTDNGLVVGFGPGIRVGSRVQPGTVLGYVGDSGNSEDGSSHLHFELHQPDRLRINPYEPLRQARRVKPKYLRTVNYREVVAEGAQFVGHLDTYSGFNGDVAVLDNYAFLGTEGNSERCPGTGVRVIDVSDPAKPTLSSSFAGHTEYPDTITSAIWVESLDNAAYQGSIAVVGLRRCDPYQPPETRGSFVGIAIYDVSDPANPTPLSVVGSGLQTVGVAAFDILVHDGQLLLAAAVPRSANDTGDALGSVRLIDLTNPARPQPLSDWEPEPDPLPLPWAPFDGEFATNGVTGVVWLDSTTLLVGRHSGQTLIVDVSDRTSPGQSSHSDSPHGELAGRSGPYVLVIEEGIQRVLAFDGAAMTDHVSISATTTATEEEPASGYFEPGGSVTAGGTQLVAAWMSDGVRLIDMTNPADPIDRARFVPAPAFDPQRWWLAPDGEDEFPMVWDVAAGHGHVFVSDHHSGLWVIAFPALDVTAAPDLR